MGVEYDLVSDSAKEAYELGKGYWGWLKSREPPWIVWDSFPNDEMTFKTDATTMIRYVEKVFEASSFDSPRERHDYAARIGTEIAAFMAKNPDWRLKDDASDDYSVTLSGEHLHKDMPPDWPCYKLAGSRYGSSLFICEACKGRVSDGCRACGGSAWIEWTREGSRPYRSRT